MCGYNIIGLIPFRSGSKRVPGKPLKELNGVPLVQYTIDQAINSELVRIYLTSDYSREELEKHIDIYNCDVITRPENLCSDSSPYTDYLDHFIYTQDLKDIHAICLLQPTCPIRRVDDINLACEKFIHHNEYIGNPTLVSAYKVSRNLLYDHTAKSIYNPKFDPKTTIYIRNSSIYIFDLEYYKKTHDIFSKRPLIYEMPAGLSVDINTLEDFNHAKRIMV